jgi:hypothetical protein
MDNKLPITRLSKFFSQEDFDLQVDIGQEYLHGDLNMKLVLYRVDKQKTDKDDVYGEVGLDEIKFFPPVEFNALVKIEEPKNSTYKGGMLRYNEPGNLVLSVYIKHLNDLKIDIKYGDYIGYVESEDKIRYYTVTNDGKVTSDNKHNLFGYKPYYRTITCAIAQEQEFRGV